MLNLAKLNITFIINISLLLLALMFIIIIINLQSKSRYNIFEQKPFEYMYNINLYKYNINGILTTNITANYWQFFPKQQESIITNPSMMLYKDNNDSYKVVANKATVNKDNLIKLSNNVNVQQYKYNQENGFNLLTSYLELHPDTDIAYTPENIVITKPGLTITATGMQANLKHNQLDLHKNVSTKYEQTNYK